MACEQSSAFPTGFGELELDPLGADAGTFATSVPPIEDAIVSFGSSYSPSHPNFSYSIDGIRVPLEDFVHHAGFILKDPLGLLDWFARKSAVPIGKLSVGVHWGKRFEVIHDANGKVFYENWKYDSELSHVNYGVEYDIFSNSSLDPTLLPQQAPKIRNATPEQQDRFNNAVSDLSNRLNANNGNNSCARLFGGLKKAKETLKKTKFSIDADLPSDVNATVKGSEIRLNPSTSRALMTPEGSSFTYYLIKVEGSGKTQEGIKTTVVSTSALKLSGVTAASFLLAHELGHRRKIYGSTDQDYDFFNSGLNNSKIWEACFSDIKPAPVRGGLVPRP